MADRQMIPQQQAPELVGMAMLQLKVQLQADQQLAAVRHESRYMHGSH